MHALIKPKFFIPVHGEYRMLSMHKRLAMSMGMAEDHVIIPRLGDVIEVSRNSCKVAGAVPAGAVLVDGLGIGDVGNVVLRDRRHLSQDGLMTVVVGLSKEENKLVSGPDIVTRGFVYVRENEELMVQAREVVKKCVTASLKENRVPDWGVIKGRIRDDLREFLYQKTKRSPMILPIIMEV